MDNCTIDCIQIIGNFSQTATCDFVSKSCVQDTVQFIQAYYCGLNQSFILLIVLSAISLAIIYTALNTLTDHYLMPCVEQFIEKLKMSQALAGVTFLAFANGAPDVVTAIVAGTSSSESTALIPFGSLNGAALFDMGFVLAMVIQFSPANKLAIKKQDALVPLGFYIFGSIYLIFVSFFYGKMNIVIALIFLGLYPIFIAWNVYEQKKLRQKKKLSLLQSSVQSSQVEEEGEEDKQEQEDGKGFRQKIEEVQKQIIEQQEESDKKSGVKGKVSHIIRISLKHLFDYSVPPATQKEWSPLRSIISLVLSPFVSMVAFGLTESFQRKMIDIPIAVWFSIPSVAFLIHSILLIFKKSSPSSSVVVYSMYSFIIVVCWITIACSSLINLMELLQMLTNINSVFLGLTVLAWANSIGDYLSITAFAKRGNASTAIAGIFSGPLFNFLLGFGISCTMQSIGGEYDFVIFDFSGDTFAKLSDSIVVSIIVMAIIYMVWIFFRILHSTGMLGASQQRIAMVSYGVFLLIALLLSIMTDFYRTEQCDL